MSRLSACGPHCGWCGRCTDELDEANRASSPDYLFCDACGKDAIHPVTLAGVGIACSRACMDTLEAQFAAAMAGRRG